MTDADLILMAQELLAEEGAEVAWQRTVYAPTDASDPGGARVPKTSTGTVLAAKMPLRGRDIASFGIIQITGREEKLIADPAADLAIGDLVTFGSHQFKIEKLTEINPTGESRILWMGVILA